MIHLWLFNIGEFAIAGEGVAGDLKQGTANADDIYQKPEDRNNLLGVTGGSAHIIIDFE